MGPQRTTGQFYLRELQDTSLDRRGESHQVEDGDTGVPREGTTFAKS